MSAQPHEHEGPPWPGSATYGERMWPAPQRVVQVPDVPILADWGHADCAICAKPATEPARGITPQPRAELRGEALRRAWLDASYGMPLEPVVSIRALTKAYALAAVCWAIIAAGVWFVWRAF